MGFIRKFFNDLDVHYEGEFAKSKKAIVDLRAAEEKRARDLRAELRELDNQVDLQRQKLAKLYTAQEDAAAARSVDARITPAQKKRRQKLLEEADNLDLEEMAQDNAARKVQLREAKKTGRKKTASKTDYDGQETRGFDDELAGYGDETASVHHLKPS